MKITWSLSTLANSIGPSSPKSRGPGDINQIMQMPNHGFQNRTIRLEGKDQKIPKNINVDLEFDYIKIFHVILAHGFATSIPKFGNFELKKLKLASFASL